MIYLCYGDEQILKNQYETAGKWVDYMLECAKEHNPLYADKPQYHNYTDGKLDAEYIYDTRFHFGEWSEPIPIKANPDEQALSVQERLLQAFKRKSWWQRLICAVLPKTSPIWQKYSAKKRL